MNLMRNRQRPFADLCSLVTSQWGGWSRGRCSQRERRWDCSPGGSQWYESAPRERGRTDCLKRLELQSWEGGREGGREVLDDWGEGRYWQDTLCSVCMLQWGFHIKSLTVNPLGWKCLFVCVSVQSDSTSTYLKEVVIDMERPFSDPSLLNVTELFMNRLNDE